MDSKLLLRGEQEMTIPSSLLRTTPSHPAPRRVGDTKVIRHWPRYLSYVTHFALAHVKAHVHARITRESRTILAWPWDWALPNLKGHSLYASPAQLGLDQRCN